jgi:hypothetical protein
VLPFMAIAGAGASLVGGIFQIGEIEKAVKERLRLMDIRAAQDVGAYKAAVGATGVESTSSTIQNHLTIIQTESKLQRDRVAAAGQASMISSGLSAMGSAASSLGKGLYEANKVTEAFGEPQADNFDEATKKLNDTLGWDWNRAG